MLTSLFVLGMASWSLLGDTNVASVIGNVAIIIKNFLYQYLMLVLIIPQMISLLLHETEAQLRSSVNNKDTIQVNGV